MSLQAALQQRILILDGAMGTMVQSFGLQPRHFHCGKTAQWSVSLVGNNEVLNLTAPQVVSQIHEAYIAAGADIISTNTFSANRISQHEYACEALAADMAYEGARLARLAADACKERKVWVAGSMGPTSKSLTLPSDINQPTLRAVDFDQMEAAYSEQAAALLRGGADVLLLETCFDALNTKAAIAAISRLNEQRAEPIPLMVSVSINDRSGRTLTGQTLEAFFISISHYPLLSFGLNCSLGAADLRPFIEQVSRFATTCVSLHPNAGLPNEMGEYDDSPENMARVLGQMARTGLLNIVGGCCGTTPRHIQAIAQAVRACPPRKFKSPTLSPLGESEGAPLLLSGLEPYRVDLATGLFTTIGERTNVAGSRRFARLIGEKRYDEAAQVARQQIEGGAQIIDINMDDAMLSSREEMQNFVRYTSADPAIARAVLMIDSSDWPSVLAGLKNSQGKSIVNSISLKEGEGPFLAKARQLRQLGAAAVVMAFDEDGQATTFQRKIDIAQRAYQLLTSIGFPPQDIIFDVNILSVGTGIKEHASYAVDFIGAVRWIKQNLPLAKTSGGVSNLSFAFRGNNTVREAMHSVFLYHAIRAGLDMAIVNAGMLQVYDEIPPKLLKAVEDVILNRDSGATERLLSLADEIKNGPQQRAAAPQTAQDEWSRRPINERLRLAFRKGITEHLSDDMPELLQLYNHRPVDVIEKPLMQAMEEVGQLFGEGKMFLPQVVKSAQVMRAAVAILQPLIDQSAETDAQGGSKKPLIVLATVNGDVHDIGKNIVSIVLNCNGFDVHDLGVMVSNEAILEATKQLQPCLVGVSGLITPSLKEMADLCRLFESTGLDVPIIVGGATTSALHTAVRLAPLYQGGVAYGGDASLTAVIAKRLLFNRAETIAQIKAEQAKIRTAYERRNVQLVPYEEANRTAPRLPSAAGYTRLDYLQRFETLQPSLKEMAERIDWHTFLAFWGYWGESLAQLTTHPEIAKTLHEGKQWLAQALQNETALSLRMALRFVNATRVGNDIRLSDGTILPTLRNQEVAGSRLSLADYFDEQAPTPIGLFCVVADTGLTYTDKKSFECLVNHALRARLAEACVAWVDETVYGKVDSAERKNAIRPAFGYPTCPDHSLKRIIFDVLDAEKRLGAHINDHYSITPSTTICGLFIAHPEARYFSVGPIDRLQLADYCRRRGIAQAEGEQLLAGIVS